MIKSYEKGHQQKLNEIVNARTVNSEMKGVAHKAKVDKLRKSYHSQAGG